jgi:DNA-binding transcriptional LysR family regulator
MEFNKLDVNKLLTFLAVAEAGGVTAAAARLALTRSAVSHSLGALEASLGVPLFHRIGRGLVPTREGRRLQRAVAEARDRLGAALDEVLGVEREARGPVRLGLFLGFARLRLSQVIEAFARDHPAARVRVSFGPHAWLMEQLLAGRLDLTLALQPTREQGRSVRSERLTVRPLVLAAHEPVRPAGEFTRIARLPIVDYYPSDPLIDRWTRHHFGGRRVPRERIRVWAASTDLALELVARGVGAAVLPEDVVEPLRARGEIAVVRGPKPPLVDHVWLNELRSARASRALAVFRALLLRQLAAPGPRARGASAADA